MCHKVRVQPLQPPTVEFEVVGSPASSSAMLLECVLGQSQRQPTLHISLSATCHCIWLALSAPEECHRLIALLSYCLEHYTFIIF